MKLEVQRLRPDAVLPGRAYAGDAGLDLVACEEVTLAPGERAVVGQAWPLQSPKDMRDSFSRDPVSPRGTGSPS